jgi:NAD(P)-dependent dehydrogenase (short-subunit alcohol dehydrogenase family)
MKQRRVHEKECSMTGRIALITGGTRNLGRAIALRLAKEGCVPALVYRADEAAKDEALALIGAVAPGTRAYRADIGSAEEVAETVARVRAEMGPIEVLVNNAYRAGRTPKKTHEVDPRELTEDLTTNLAGQFLMSRACIPSMLEKRFGRIVFIASIAMQGERGRVAYSMAKTGMIGMMRTIALEYAKDGITSNIVSAGFLETGAFLRFSQEIRERALARVPSRRAGRPEDVAAAVAYLCSDEASYTTGSVLSVDGAATTG